VSVCVCARLTLLLEPRLDLPAAPTFAPFLFLVVLLTAWYKKAQAVRCDGMVDAEGGGLDAKAMRVW